MARILGRAAARLYAAPSYLPQHRGPPEPADLGDHRLIDNAPTAPTHHRRLVPVLASWATRRLAVHAVFPSHKSLSPALRAFVDPVALRLGPTLEPANR